ncbi:MAG: hypothetical protein EPN36_05440 [Rhodanobacteraceae bacterium]|nr:MAG: hypothetical protein EPN36_05440 [Rhodanobacteraceae bacterium]
MVMSTCRFCGKWAGFFRDQHDECAAKHSSAKHSTRVKLLTSLDDAIEKNLGLPAWTGHIPPINLIDGEKVVWIFRDVEYLADKRKRSYVGGYGGPSVRVFRGVWMRSGAFRGEPITHVDRLSQGSGSLILTSANIYFYGDTTSLRVPYKKIASFLSFSNGVGIVRDSQSALPVIFVTGDDLAFQVLTRIAKIAGNPQTPAPRAATWDSDEVKSDPDRYAAEINDPELDDSLYANAVAALAGKQQVSLSGLRRALRISYTLTSQLLEMMETEGVVGPPGKDGVRQILRA